MKTANIKIQYDFDGPDPGRDKEMEALCKLIGSLYIGSECIDGTDKWALDVITFEVEILKEGGK